MASSQVGNPRLWDTVHGLGLHLEEPQLTLCPCDSPAACSPGPVPRALQGQGLGSPAGLSHWENLCHGSPDSRATLFLWEWPRPATSRQLEIHSSV